MSISVIILAGTSFALSNVTTQGNTQHIIDEAEKINFKVANSDELTTACGKIGVTVVLQPGVTVTTVLSAGSL
ncbi:hypothetical protein [Fluviispira sanaruensis]|uniref:Uncharacterized protein n=1 Tax=Fluviispira sanaruensis TaxID=2493639 RepID=A0A4P2VQ83_FLUSA|nr:hypothetical protein [Fluviispira sanaruensis]BBH54520.1 hypothetical protein JCM31447_29910 [Fluviispira sanaruensis]